MLKCLQLKILAWQQPHRFLSEEDLSGGQQYILHAPPEYQASSPLSPSTPNEIFNHITGVNNSIEGPIMPTEKNYDSSMMLPSTTNTTDELPFVPQHHPLRYSGHVSHPPTWIKDYVCAAFNSPGTHYPVSSMFLFIGYHHNICVILAKYPRKENLSDMKRHLPTHIGKRLWKQN